MKKQTKLSETKHNRCYVVRPESTEGTHRHDPPNLTSEERANKERKRAGRNGCISHTIHRELPSHTEHIILHSNLTECKSTKTAVAVAQA